MRGKNPFGQRWCYFVCVSCKCECVQHETETHTNTHTLNVDQASAMNVNASVRAHINLASNEIERERASKATTGFGARVSARKLVPFAPTNFALRPLNLSN